MAGSSPVFRSKTALAVFISLCSSGVEHFLGREEVVSSILTNGSKEFDEERLNDVVSDATEFDRVSVADTIKNNNW